ncbi:unnamed protein product [Durusdinium trenchii]|uniref:Uncharacterized protein n=1 Tax=Durusdinium trenchii TaxID=1381693 RepID=A0ABP0QY62_9DINO
MSLAFGWQAPFKRLKTAPQVHQELGSAFAACEEEIEDELLEPNLTANITGQLEDAELKRKRLRSEGSVLAQAERYAEALQHWEEALLFTDDPCEKAPILELLGQQVSNESFPTTHGRAKVGLSITEADGSSLADPGASLRCH